MTMTDISLWNGKTAPRIGIGTWVMGGQQYVGTTPIGWSNVDDATSVRTLHTAFDMGVRIIDTADQYGAGHAERVIAESMKRSSVPRDAFVICTKVGNLCDPNTGDLVGATDQRQDLTNAIDASLARLETDYIDLVHYHINRHPIAQSTEVFEAFSKAYDAGKIGGFGWSTDCPEGAIAFAKMDGYVAVQHDLNLFSPADAMLSALENHEIWAFARQPLGMGLLSGKYRKDSPKADSTDIRSSGMDWLRYFTSDGRPTPDLLDAVEQMRSLLTQDGRSVAQGALAWCLAQSDRTIPLPGCRTPDQALDNFGVLDSSPIDNALMSEIERLAAQFQRSASP